MIYTSDQTQMLTHYFNYQSGTTIRPIDEHDEVTAADSLTYIHRTGDSPIINSACTDNPSLDIYIVTNLAPRDDIMPTFQLAEAMHNYFGTNPLFPEDMGFYTTSFLAKHLTAAKNLLGRDVVYNEQLFEELELNEFTEDHYLSNDTALQHRSLDDILEQAIAPLRMRGNIIQQIRSSDYNNISNKHNVIDVLNVGQRRFMVKNFIPNGMKEVACGKSYLKMRPPCNDALLEVVNQGRAIVFLVDALKQHNAMDHLHVNPTSWAPKTGKLKGRTCLNASYKSKNYFSLNESVDFDKHDSKYPEIHLPTLADIAEMICVQRQLYPGQPLDGATVDVSSAYQQYPQSVASAKLHTTMVKTLKNAT